jgi:hypothetical protein
MAIKKQMTPRVYPRRSKKFLWLPDFNGRDRNPSVNAVKSCMLGVAEGVRTMQVRIGDQTGEEMCDARDGNIKTYVKESYVLIRVDDDL